MRVCVNQNRGRYCFLFSKGPLINDIRGHSHPKNICQIARNRIYFFKIFWGGLPPALAVRGFTPLPGSPFPKFLDPPLLPNIIWSNLRPTNCSDLSLVQYKIIKVIQLHIRQSWLYNINELKPQLLRVQRDVDDSIIYGALTGGFGDFKHVSGKC